MFGKILDVAKIVAPAAAGLGLGGPVGAVLTASAQVSAAVEKRRGRKRESTGRKPLHKVTAPTAAVAVPTVLAALFVKLGVPGAEDLAQVACSSPEMAGAQFGGLAVLLHQFFGGAKTAREGRKR